MEELIVNLDGKEYKVNIEESEEGKLKVYFEGRVFEVETKADVEQAISFEKTEEKGHNIVLAPLPGTVSSVNVKAGDKVKKGSSLVKIIAMKMENDITALKEGKVKEVKVKRNDNVNKGDVLVVLE